MIHVVAVSTDRSPPGSVRAERVTAHKPVENVDPVTIGLDDDVAVSGAPCPPITDLLLLRPRWRYRAAASVLRPLNEMAVRHPDRPDNTAVESSFRVPIAGA